jgi:predicted amidohydrolase YtcJ
VLEGETAALLDPYLGPRAHRGTLHIEPKALARALTRLDAHGIQGHLHTIGDRAVRVTLDAIETARRANRPRRGESAPPWRSAGGNRHHLAHLQLVDPADVARFAALDVTATFQSLWAYPDSYVRDNVAQVGPERVARMYPIGSIHRAGGRIAGGSDWPVSSLNPLLAIEVAVTRQDPAGRADQPAPLPKGAPAIAGGDARTLNAAERVDLDTMLAAYTLQGAWLMRQESTTGSIEVGKMADLVVLERDLFAIAPADIGEGKVLRTMIEGQTVYRAGD